MATQTDKPRPIRALDLAASGDLGTQTPVRRKFDQWMKKVNAAKTELTDWDAAQTAFSESFVALIAAVCIWPIFPVMGRDYDSAVMSGGLCGFMLGTTANAMANMKALTDRFGPAPRAFLVVPMVGAFFIDFVNAVLITFCLNIWG